MPVEPSFEKLDYRLRPAKQVERRLIGNVLQHLFPKPLDLATYHYLGMGSVYYADFVLYHNMFNFERMTCVELEPIPKRMEFNRPFQCVDVVIGDIGDYVAKLDTSRPQVSWLDYDEDLSDSKVLDVSSLTAKSPLASIIIVSVKAHYATDGKVVDLLSTLGPLFNPFLDRPLETQDISGKELQRKAISAIEGIIRKAIRGRKDLDFLPLFRFAYADGARMATAGGLLGDAALIKEAQAKVVNAAGYCGASILELTIPKLTARERAYLDKKLPSTVPLTKLPFEIGRIHVKGYERYYRFLPKYAEVVD